MLKYKMILFLLLTALLNSSLLAEKGVKSECQSLAATLADHPKDAIIAEAEDFTLVGDGWYTTKNTHAVTGFPSQGRVLNGHRGAAGNATYQLTIKKPGKYTLWIRYIELIMHREKIGFTVTVSQNGNIIKEKLVDDGPAKRSTREGKKKWGGGWAAFVWERVDVDLEKGPCKIELSKVDHAIKTSLARNIDCIVLTQDPTYEPNVSHFQVPLYMKIDMLSQQKEPVAALLRMISASAAGKNKSCTINRNGIFAGEKKAKNASSLLISNESTPWVKISNLLHPQNNKFNISLRTQQNKKYFPWDKRAYIPKESYFKVYFSKTAGMTGLIKSYTREGRGNGLTVSVNLRELSIKDERELSTENLQAAKQAPDIGTRPKKFVFQTGMRLGSSNTEEAIDNEIKTLEALNINGMYCDMSFRSRFNLDNRGFIRYYGGRFIFWYGSKGCLNNPWLSGLKSKLKEYADKVKKNDLDSKMDYIDLMDEPSFHMTHILKCPNCQSAFINYLKKQGLTLQELGIKSWDDALLQPNGKSFPELYYYTVKFRSWSQGNFYRHAADILKNELPQVKPMANFACESIYSLHSKGSDWFEIYRTGGLSYGWTEDWLNMTETKQITGYQVDLMRAACRERGLTYGMYNILGGSPWDIQARAFTQIGRGISTLFFFNYGPSYNATADSQSHRKEIFPAIKYICGATGAVEEHLIGGTIPQGDAAMVYSSAGDIWHLDEKTPQNNYFGQERTYLHLLLRHIGCRLDILNDPELTAKVLRKYKLLFIVDSHLPKKSVETLVQWVNNGGTLYLGGGSAMYDEFNRDSMLNNALGIKRGEFKLEQHPGWAYPTLSSRKVIDEIEYNTRSIPAVCGIEKNATKCGEILACGKNGAMTTVRQVGKGKVILNGYLPGLSYMYSGAKRRQAKSKAEKKSFFAPQYPDAPRKLFRQILSIAGVNPIISTDQPLIDATIIESDNAVIIIFANWYGEMKTTTVTLNNYPAFKKIKGVVNQPEIVTNKQNELIIKMAVGPGDYLICEK